MNREPIVTWVTFVGTVLTVAANPAWAYIGPGAGLSAIGSLFAFIGALVLGIIGFVWYPIKRLVRRRSKSSRDQCASSNSVGTGDND